MFSPHFHISGSIPFAVFQYRTLCSGSRHRRLARLVSYKMPACCISFIQTSIKRWQQGKAKAHLLLLIDTSKIFSN
jgi:hypothetical protein